MSERTKQIAQSLEKIAQPFLLKLKEKKMDHQYKQILDLIRAIETDAFQSCNSLYLILQNKAFDTIQDEGGEAADQLWYLFELMREVSIGGLMVLLYKFDKE